MSHPDHPGRKKVKHNSQVKKHLHFYHFHHDKGMVTEISVTNSLREQEIHESLTMDSSQIIFFVGEQNEH
jgi:hypothetical protein